MRVLTSFFSCLSPLCRRCPLLSSHRRLLTEGLALAGHTYGQGCASKPSPQEQKCSSLAAAAPSSPPRGSARVGLESM